MGLNFTLFSTLAENFKCPRCKGTSASTQFFIYKSSENVCVSCKNCGFTETFNYHVQDAKYQVLK
jgi:transcription elongation factor Elf1